MRDLTLKLLLTRTEPLQHRSVDIGARLAFIGPLWWWIQVFLVASLAPSWGPCCWGWGESCKRAPTKEISLAMPRNSRMRGIEDKTQTPSCIQLVPIVPKSQHPGICLICEGKGSGCWWGNLLLVQVGQAATNSWTCGCLLPGSLSDSQHGAQNLWVQRQRTAMCPIYHLTS